MFLEYGNKPYLDTIDTIEFLTTINNAIHALYTICRPNRDTREELQAVVDKKKSSKLS